jgi:hypothetical protein
MITFHSFFTTSRSLNIDATSTKRIDSGASTPRIQTQGMDGLLGISRKFPAKQRTTVSLVVGKNNMCVTPSKISKYRYIPHNLWLLHAL